MRLRLCLEVLALTTASAALAQAEQGAPQFSDATPPDSQSSSPSEALQGPPQVSSNSDSLAVETQLTAPLKSVQQPPQLSSGGPNAQAPAQLSSGRPTAQAPEPLSKPADGRTAAVERVEGADRCDPAIPKAKQSDECKKVIESRADDYARPQPPELSPEQRLLIDQQMNGAGEAISEAARRLAKSGDPDSSNDAMGIAAIVLQQSAPKAPEPKQNEDPTTQAAVDAIIQMVTQGPQ